MSTSPLPTKKLIASDFNRKAVLSLLEQYFPTVLALLITEYLGNISARELLEAYQLDNKELLVDLCKPAFSSRRSNGSFMGMSGYIQNLISSFYEMLVDYVKYEKGEVTPKLKAYQNIFLADESQSISPLSREEVFQRLVQGQCLGKIDIHNILVRPVRSLVATRGDDISRVCDFRKWIKSNPFSLLDVLDILELNDEPTTTLRAAQFIAESLLLDPNYTKICLDVLSIKIILRHCLDKAGIKLDHHLFSPFIAVPVSDKLQPFGSKEISFDYSFKLALNKLLKKDRAKSVAMVISVDSTLQSDKQVYLHVEAADYLAAIIGDLVTIHLSPAAMRKIYAGRSTLKKDTSATLTAHQDDLNGMLLEKTKEPRCVQGLSYAGALKHYGFLATVKQKGVKHLVDQLAVLEPSPKEAIAEILNDLKPSFNLIEPAASLLPCESNLVVKGFMPAYYDELSKVVDNKTGLDFLNKFIPLLEGALGKSEDKKLAIKLKVALEKAISLQNDLRWVKTEIEEGRVQKSL